MEGLYPRQGGRNPENPEWQEQESGIPAKDVRALAGSGGLGRPTWPQAGSRDSGAPAVVQREPSGRDPWSASWHAGAGKAGVNMGGMQQGTPLDHRFYFRIRRGGLSGISRARPCREHVPADAQLASVNTVYQRVPRLKVPRRSLKDVPPGIPRIPRRSRGSFEIRLSAPGMRRSSSITSTAGPFRHHVRHEPLRQGLSLR